MAETIWPCPRETPRLSRASQQRPPGRPAPGTFAITCAARAADPGRPGYVCHHVRGTAARSPAPGTLPSRARPRPPGRPAPGTFAITCAATAARQAEPAHGDFLIECPGHRQPEAAAPGLSRPTGMRGPAAAALLTMASRRHPRLSRPFASATGRGETRGFHMVAIAVGRAPDLPDSTSGFDSHPVLQPTTGTLRTSPRCLWSGPFLRPRLGLRPRRRDPSPGSRVDAQIVVEVWRGGVGLLRLLERQPERVVDHLPAGLVGPVDEGDRDPEAPARPVRPIRWT